MERGAAPAESPAVIAFDVIETLFPLEPMCRRLEDVGESPHLLELWFTRTLRDGFALSASGGYRPFPEVAAGALTWATGGRVTHDQVSHVLGGFAELDPHPDVEPATRPAHEAEVRRVSRVARSPQGGAMAQELWGIEAASFDDQPDHGLADPRTREAWRDLLLEVLPTAPARVADDGCGTGTLTRLLTDEGYAVDGLHLSQWRSSQVATCRFGPPLGADQRSARRPVAQGPNPGRHQVQEMTPPYAPAGAGATSPCRSMDCPRSNVLAITDARSARRDGQGICSVVERRRS